MLAGGLGCRGGENDGGEQEGRQGGRDGRQGGRGGNDSLAHVLIPRTRTENLGMDG
jgi:hypothetical protein